MQKGVPTAIIVALFGTYVSERKYALILSPTVLYLLVRPVVHCVFITESRAMRPWVDRNTYPSTTLQYLVDFVLNLLLATAGIVLVMALGLLFAHIYGSIYGSHL